MATDIEMPDAAKAKESVKDVAKDAAVKPAPVDPTEEVITGKFSHGWTRLR